jgi:hypothetical protein
MFNWSVLMDWYLRKNEIKVLKVKYKEVFGSFKGKTLARGMLTYIGEGHTPHEVEVTYIGFLHEKALILFREVKTGQVLGCHNCFMNTDDQ